MPRNVLILNGPNLNLLGMREPQIYGSETLDEIETACRRHAEGLRLAVTFRQSNAEGGLIDMIQEALDAQDAIVVNAGAYTHSSVAIYDALCLFDGLVIEVHISNIHKRESFRHHSFVSARADGIIVGCGTHGYRLALSHVAERLDG